MGVEDLLCTLGWQAAGAVVASQVDELVVSTPGLRELDTAMQRRAIIMAAAILVEQLKGHEIPVPEGPLSEASEADAWAILKAGGKSLKPQQRPEAIQLAVASAIAACAARGKLVKS